MTRSWCCAVLVAAFATTAACDDEAGVQGHRGPCASSAGAFVGCEDVALDSPEDACWRLVDCGVIPLAQNDPELQWVTDWDECVADLARLPSERLDLVLACFAAASCDDLLLNNSPTTPGGEPLCYQFGRIEQ